jgi:hypothetical protein
LLIYMKTNFVKELFADLHGYRQAHPGFPNQSTGNQFFDEKQFEAYRELGFQTTWMMLRDLRQGANSAAAAHKAVAGRLLWG